MTPNSLINSNAPVRVYTLGRFLIEVESEPLRFETKAKRKPIDLLKALIALGGHSVATELLSESLWPDSDGDRAQNALATTLNRLRKLIGHEGLTLRDGRLTLETGHCWVDALQCAALLKQASRAWEDDDNQLAWKVLEQAMAIYDGPFLEGEFDPPEILSAREKLHGSMLRHIGKAGEIFQKAGDYAGAIDLYRRGLEIDDLAEEFYQLLMRCFLGQGRLAEGMAVYQRCKETLKKRMDIDLSPATGDIHQSLLDAQNERPSTPAAEPQPHPPASAVSTHSPPRSEAPPVVHDAGGNDSPAAPPSARDGPSIAVLPFVNMSGDPEQDYFSDGISEDIITDLSSISDLLVIARNSSFVYKGKAVDVRQVGRDLGVGYVLEGSVRKAGTRVRITAQLIDAAIGNHIWAKRFDRTLDDLFAVQDEITEEIVSALDVTLLDGELERVWQKYLKTYEARALYRSGIQFFRRPTKDGNIGARQKFEQVMTLEPESPAGYNATGWSHWWDARYGWSEDPARSLARASELVQESLEKDDKYPTANSLLASVFLLEGEFKRAIEVGKQAEVLAPNHAHIVAFLAGILNYSGNPKEAIGKAQKAIQLTPSTPSWYLALLASANYGCGRFEEAIRAAREGISINQEEQDARLYKAAAHEALGQHDEAVQDVKTALESVPDFPYGLREDPALQRSGGA